jgi:hypothetical protein
MDVMTRRHDCEAPSPALIAPPWLPVPPVAYGGTENMIDILARGLWLQPASMSCSSQPAMTTCPMPRRWVFPRALGVGNGGVAEEACHVIGAYAMMRDVDIVHDNSMVGPLYALRVPSPLVVTTNHGPFNQILTPVYQPSPNERR